MAVEIHLYTEVYRRVGVRTIKVELNGKTRLSELLSGIPELDKALKYMEEDCVPYIVLVNGRYTSYGDDPIISEDSHIKLFTPVSGGI